MSGGETLPLFNPTSSNPSGRNMAPNTKSAVSECISDDALAHLKTYKYSSVDLSPVSKYILGPFWNAFVELLPLWLAPNMVTLLGFFFILGNIILLEIYMPDLVGPGPSWLYFSFAFGLFMYQTMDNVDGKQARRTGTSSGLGELFDHGIDSLNCTLASLLETAAMGLGTTHAGVFTALCPCLPMFFSTWETYHTHTLYLGVINGPTEGLLIACSVMIMSGIYGPGIWTQPMNHLLGEHLPSLAHLLGETTFRDIWISLIVGSLVFTQIPFCVYNVIQARRKNGLPVLPVFLEWTPMAVYTISIGLWVFSPYSTLMEQNHLMLLCLTLSFVFGRMTTKMILAHLTHQPFPYWTVMLWPLVGGAIIGNLPRFGFSQVTAQFELNYLWAYFFFALVVYFRWAFLVVGSICEYLGINALTIPKEKQVANKLARDATKLH
ncbi:CDP-alcohol phosphatidyltransferase-domain-containing protein [Dactylonectria macrodidyma]|uniref:CDP-alcohol phosphatidyltransferase-domain-containing protein n=1 Tax=Dactylonectria macrodidyma TaxID=307937 RepID=A0A9P9F9W4_9HYPO|nr:CDP-alcohol phosphatidyltransferase-domain-containing protein [Dactylonectria macrodidyma]